MRAWRFAVSEFGALRAERRRLGVRRAVVQRVKSNLDLDGVDGETLSTLAARIDATRAELAAAVEQKDRELAAARETIAAYAGLTDAIAAQLEHHNLATPYVAGPAMVERLLALGYWLAEQPPTDLLVSVIIPTRERPDLVLEAIASVQAQTHPHWEAIVVDDGSVDRTRATLAAIDDERVRCIRTDGYGPAGGRNAGLSVARGQVVAYLDDDNLMLRGWLAAVAWAFARFDDVDVLYGARVVEDESPLGSGGVLPRLFFCPFDRDRLLQSSYLDTNMIAHRAGLPQAYWDRGVSGAADWDLMIRLTESKPALALPVASVLYRTGAPHRVSHSGLVAEGVQKLQERLKAERP